MIVIIIGYAQPRMNVVEQLVSNKNASEQEYNQIDVLFHSALLFLKISRICLAARSAASRVLK